MTWSHSPHVYKDPLLRDCSSLDLVLTVMFLAGGNKKEEVKQGAQGEGLPSSFVAGRRAYLARLARGMTEASRGIEGTNSKEGEQCRYSDCCT
jgi:hypothetical protein